MKMKLQKGFAPIILEIAVVVLLIGAFILANPKFKISQQPTPSPKLSPSPSPTSVHLILKGVLETTNWKTYRYEQYDFKISYPPDWETSISKTFAYGALGLTSPKDSKENFVSLSIQRFNKDDKSTIFPPEMITSTNLLIDGTKAYRDEGMIRNPDGPGSQNVYLLRGNFVYLISFQVFKKYNLPSQYKYEDIKPAKFTQEEKDIRDTLLSTFKFLDRNQITENNKSCSQNSDCALLLCGGCFNKEWVEKAPPDLPCARYEGYSCSCISSTCTEVK